MEKGVDPMTLHGLFKIIQEFEKRGPFDVQSGSGKKIINSTVVEEVATAVQEELSASVQSTAKLFKH